MEGDAIYNSVFTFLEKFKLLNEANYGILVNMHFGYLRETFDNMHNTSYDTLYLLRMLEEIVNDESLNQYINFCSKEIWSWILGLVEKIEERENHSPVLWDSYLVRYKYILNVSKENRDGLILPILLSVLVDPRNKRNIGLDIMCSLKCEYKSINTYKQYSLNRKKWLNTYPEGFVERLISTDETTQVKELRKLLIEKWNQEDYEQAAQYLEELLRRTPFDRDAFYIRIQFNLLIEEYDFAVQLCTVAKVLWPYDIEMQYLCIDIIAKYGGY